MKCFAPDEKIMFYTFRIRGTLVFVCPKEREREKEREGRGRGGGRAREKEKYKDKDMEKEGEREKTCGRLYFLTTWARVRNPRRLKKEVYVVCS